ncbi:MAG: histidine phosphatase family protein [Verrucomicrobiota bacterium]
MKIYLLRHAKADPGFPDSSRVLAPRGRQHASELGKFFTEDERLGPLEIWCSPLKRAQETALLFEKSWGGSILARHEVEQLEPEIDPEPLVEMISLASRDLLIVGHNPSLETLTSLLLSGERTRARVRLKTCGFICLEWNPLPNFGQFGPCELRWMFDPRLI